MRVYKYEIPIEKRFSLELPLGAQVLDVQTQRGGPYLWALVDTKAPLREREFIMRRTGHDVDSAERLRHCGTFQMNDGTLVFHVFEVG